ncbi:DUF2510 domain-containing protein [Streptomyces sp. NPDC046805]|uniref:DUF2510 domain-containing protein n=1 Tax=Streptomyces sp. NPDC046805 TaxID=3155134 RepID=UPI0033F6C97F
MTQATPPGWHPDPGQTIDTPPTERWWDGTAWTDHTRPAGSAAAWVPPTQPSGAGAYPAAPLEQAPYPACPGYGGYPGYPVQPPPGARRGLRAGIAVAIAAAVLACVGIGAYAIAKGAGSDGDRAGRQPSPGRSALPRVKGGGTVPDPVNGISFPVPDGWTGQTAGAGAQLGSDDTYKCPGDTTKKCTAGGAYSAPAVALGSEGGTPEEVAKADIAANAKESYGGAAYGRITSHDVLVSKAVTVAGERGYLVRWKAVTSKGADGYVESLAFPSPRNTERMVVVRFGVDAGREESVIDEITKGIKASSAGDVGQKV